MFGDARCAKMIHFSHWLSAQSSRRKIRRQSSPRIPSTLEPNKTPSITHIDIPIRLMMLGLTSLFVFVCGGGAPFRIIVTHSGLFHYGQESLYINRCVCLCMSDFESLWHLCCMWMYSHLSFCVCASQMTGPHSWCQGSRWGPSTDEQKLPCTLPKH